MRGQPSGPATSSTTQQEFLERYPGDDVIDLLGFDDYWSVKTVETRPQLISRLKLLSKMAREPGKLAAVTETGRNSNDTSDRQNHFYASHPSHPSAPDFVRFCLFEDELSHLYR